MIGFRLIGAAALSLLIATPVVAMQRADHHRRVSLLRHARNYRSIYRAYGFDRDGDIRADFDRRNAFN